MSKPAKRRRSGSMPLRIDRKSGRKYIEARYQPPVDAYSKLPGLFKWIISRFTLGLETQAENS